VQIHRQYRYFEKVDKNTTRVVLLNDVDPGLGIVPDQVKNMMLKKGFSTELPAMKKAFTDIKPEFARKLESKPEFYRSMAEFVAGE
jgi:hypothetical protein